MGQPAQKDLLEFVSCGLCGADEFDVVHEARYDQEKDLDLVQKFRASGDELLIDRLVKCGKCGLQYVNPRLRGDLIFTSYTEGEDETYVSQLAARERTFDASLVEIERLAGGRGKAAALHGREHVALEHHAAAPAPLDLAR